MFNRKAGDVFTKDAPKVGDRRTFDVKFVPITGDELSKFMTETNVDELPAGYVAGWASTETKDHVSDVVRAGAFDNAIAERGLDGPGGIKLLIQHDHDKPAGKIVKLEQRKQGLWIEAQMNLNISYVKDMYEAAKMQGGLNFSIGYRLVKDGFRFVDLGDDRSYWELTELDLFEVSVVTFPCNDDAQMVFIKGVTDNGVFNTVAEFEKALVADANSVKSRNEARAITLAVKRNLHLFAPKQEQSAKPVQAVDEKSLNKISSAIADLNSIFSKS